MSRRQCADRRATTPRYEPSPHAPLSQPIEPCPDVWEEGATTAATRNGPGRHLWRCATTSATWTAWVLVGPRADPPGANRLWAGNYGWRLPGSHTTNPYSTGTETA